MIKIMGVGILAAVLLTGCCNCNKKSSFPFQETVWQLTQLNGKAVKADNNFTIAFLNTGRITGKGACNTFFGPWELTKANGSEIKIGPVASTMMACPDMETESAFFQALEKITEYRMEGGKLYLYEGQNLRAVLQGTDKRVK